MTSNEQNRPKLSFMSANFLGREKGYRNVVGFGEGNLSIAEKFSPIATYRTEIGRLFEDIAKLGFSAVDLWTAHCNPKWATPAHYKAVKEAAQEHGMVISSLAGGFGRSLEMLETYCQMAVEIGIPVLGVGCALLPQCRDEVVAVLDRYGVKLGFENHPNEPTPADVLEKIGCGRFPNLGVTLDTGWFATHNYPVVDAITELKDHLLLVHLKNIQAPGAHVAAPWDNGCLEFEPIVRRLLEVGYSGYISIEYEPLDHDPSQSCVSARQAVERWINNQ